MASQTVRRTSFALPTRRETEASGYVGRERPVVRRPALVRRSVESSGLREGLPFFFFGAVCLFLAVVFYTTNPVPGNPIPISPFLAAIGAVAIGGGILGAFVRGEPASPGKPTWVRQRDVRPPPLPPAPRARRDPASPAVAGPAAAPPRGAAASVRTEPRARPTPEELFPLPAFDAPAPPRLAAESAPAMPSGPILGESAEDPADDVLRSIDEISSAIRRGRRPMAKVTAAVSAAPPARTCGNCESAIAPTEPDRSCRVCSTVLCAGCAGSAAREGAPGLCPTCALLEVSGEAAPAP